MKLFHESENKYFELLSYMLADDREYTTSEINDYIETHVVGEADGYVVDALFSKKEGEEALFMFDDGKFIPVIDSPCPIRATNIEKQTFAQIINDTYARHFVSANTLAKISKLTENVDVDWDTNDIKINNQFVVEEVPTFYNSIQIIKQAIEEHRGIIYDNIKPGVYEYIDSLVYPLKIEYSLVNDRFRLVAYEPKENRFIKMNLYTMKNIRYSDDVIEDLESDYKEYLNANLKKLTLDVEPVDHVIERCFRIFSFYDRRAVYDKDNDKYSLEIQYYKFDQNEVIRDILSLGSSVTVIEPKMLQREIVRRIKNSVARYKED